MDVGTRTVASLTEEANRVKRAQELERKRKRDEDDDSGDEDDDSGDDDVSRGPYV